MDAIEQLRAVGYLEYVTSTPEWGVLLDDAEPIINRLLAKAWEEGRCAAARGQKNNPYIDNLSKDGED